MGNSNCNERTLELEKRGVGHFEVKLLVRVRKGQNASLHYFNTFLKRYHIVSYLHHWIYVCVYIYILLLNVLASYILK